MIRHKDFLHMESILHLSKQAVVLLSAFSCCTGIRVSRTNLPNKGFPPRMVGGSRTGREKLYKEGTMQELIVMHGEEGKRTVFFLLPTLYSISGVLVSFDFLFVFLLCKRRTFRQAIRHWKRVITVQVSLLASPEEQLWSHVPSSAPFNSRDSASQVKEGRVPLVKGVVRL